MQKSGKSFSQKSVKIMKILPRNSALRELNHFELLNTSGAIEPELKGKPDSNEKQKVRSETFKPLFPEIRRNKKSSRILQVF